MTAVSGSNSVTPSTPVPAATTIPLSMRYYRNGGGIPILPPTTQATPPVNAPKPMDRPPTTPSVSTPSKPNPRPRPLPVVSSMPRTSTNSQGLASKTAGVNPVHWTPPVASTMGTKRTYEQMASNETSSSDRARTADSFKTLVAQHAKQVANKLGAQISASTGVAGPSSVAMNSNKPRVGGVSVGVSSLTNGNYIPSGSAQVASRVVTATKMTARKPPKLTPVEFQTENGMYEALAQLQKRVKREQQRHDSGHAIDEKKFLQFHGFYSVVAKDHLKDKQKARLVGMALRKQAKVPVYLKDLIRQESNIHRAVAEYSCRCLQPHPNAKGKAPATAIELPGMDIDDGTSSEANSSVHMNQDTDMPDEPMDANGHKPPRNRSSEENCRGTVIITVEEDKSHPFVKGQKITVEISHMVASSQASEARKEWDRVMGLTSLGGVVADLTTT
ncbi:hypothetical protein BDN72DRAFT_838132 [Pluteus cervinus]|uniref:Uncharacterized protein n=1 Tax=Pluteus cervinus TaxID=181527 RepID=A0ACD3B0L8_9AGAR|nr:hypothetical protein BDN72DRAFT_838132 [Pluteus cervinus]